MLLCDGVKDAAKLHHPQLEFNRLFKVSYAISSKKLRKHHNNSISPLLTPSQP